MPKQKSSSAKGKGKKVPKKVPAKNAAPKETQPKGNKVAEKKQAEGLSGSKSRNYNSSKLCSIPTGISSPFNRCTSNF